MTPSPRRGHRGATDVSVEIEAAGVLPCLARPCRLPGPAASTARRSGLKAALASTDPVAAELEGLAEQLVLGHMGVALDDLAQAPEAERANGVGGVTIIGAAALIRSECIANGADDSGVLNATNFGVVLGGFAGVEIFEGESVDVRDDHLEVSSTLSNRLRMAVCSCRRASKALPCWARSTSRPACAFLRKAGVILGFFGDAGDGPPQGVGQARQGISLAWVDIGGNVLHGGPARCLPSASLLPSASSLMIREAADASPGFQADKFRSGAASRVNWMGGEPIATLAGEQAGLEVTVVIRPRRCGRRGGSGAGRRERGIATRRYRRAGEARGREFGAL